MKQFPALFLASMLTLGAGPALAQSEPRPEPAVPTQHLGKSVRARIAVQHHQRAISAQQERDAVFDMYRALSRSPQSSTPDGKAALEALQHRARDDARRRWFEVLADHRTYLPLY